jgi:hypothetical protein
LKEISWAAISKRLEEKLNLARKPEIARVKKPFALVKLGERLLIPKSYMITSGRFPKEKALRYKHQK